MINNYTLYHLHSDYSLLDSTTPFQKYVDWAVEQGMTAIGFCEHGNIFNWTTKKEYCDNKGIKYIHGVELYLTEKLFHKRNKVTEKKDGSYQWELVKQKIRDNYHIILLAKNLDGIKEINTLVSMADDEEHSYYKPRISFEEAVNISDNVFVISACFLKGTDVETNNGHILIQDIQSGMKVLTHDNTYQDVIIPTTREYHGDIYNIHTTGGALDIQCTSNHKFLCINKNDVEHNYTSFNKTYELDVSKYIPVTRQKISKAFRNYQPEWVEAERLTKDMYMLTPIYTHVDTKNTIDIEFANFPMKNGHPHHKLKSYCIDYSPMLFELFGLYVAEGSMNRYSRCQVVFSLSGSEEHLALRILDYAEKIFGIRGTYRFKTDSYGIDVYLSSIELYKVFEHYFLHGAANKNIPQFIKDAPPNLQMYFIKGLFLGDGYSRKNISRVTFATISKELFYDTVQILYRNSINPCCLKKPAYTGKDGVYHQDSYYIDINGQLGKYISDFIWNDCNFDSKSLQHRYQKDIPFIWNGVWYMKQSITKISHSYQDTQVYCLNVNNNHSFIANGVIAHNCLAAPLWSWKNTVEKYQSEINSINVEIENYKLSKEKYIAELNGNVPIRKKKRKPEVIQQDITKCDDYIKNLSENIEYIKQDIECITFNENPDSLFFKLFNRYDYLEIQPHVNSDDQKEYNRWLLQMSKKYEKPIICGTDTHNYDSYAAECRTIMQIAKGIEFLEEDTFDLTLHTCTELAELLASQGVLDEGEIQVSIANTNAVAALCDDFELDKSFKYPVFETPESDSDAFYRQSLEGLDRKIEIGAIKKEDRQTYIDRIEEEMRVLRKVGMGGFMLSMHKFLGKMRADGLPLGFSRGSCFTDSAIVKCLNGYKTINSVTIHDKVLSEDNQYHQVIHTTSQIVCDELIEVIPSLITIDAPIRCTKDHLFYVIRDNIKQYVKACTLKSSDLLIMPYRSNTYKYIPVEEILTLPKMEYKVYDIKVADTHNYTVNGFVVHNCGGCLTAYLTDITDIDPIVWGLSFERFCNENRVSLGD